MKTHIMFRRALTALAFAAVLALPPALVQAQTNAAPQLKKPVVPGGADQAEEGKSQASAPVKFDIEIVSRGLRLPGKNGLYSAHLDSIVDFLREHGFDGQIAMSPGLAGMLIENLKLHAATVEEVLEGLRVASGDKFTWKATNLSSDSAVPFYSLEATDRFLRTRDDNRSRQPVVEVFNLSSYFAQMRSSQPTNDAAFDVIKAKEIETTKEIIGNILKRAWGFDGATNALQYQFHPGANLLVVTGRDEDDMEEAMNIAKKIINAMIEQPSAPPAGDYSVQIIGKDSKLTYLSDGGQIVSWPDGVSGQVRFNHVSRLNPDGSVDTNFNPVPPGANSTHTNH